jgi:hypothetical protein
MDDLSTKRVNRSARNLGDVVLRVHAMFMAAQIALQLPVVCTHHFHGMLPAVSMDHVRLASAAMTDRHVAKS